MNTAHYRPQITLVIIGNNSRNTHTHTRANSWRKSQLKSFEIKIKAPGYFVVVNIASDQLTCKKNNNQSGRSQWAESNSKKLSADEETKKTWPLLCITKRR